MKKLRYFKCGSCQRQYERFVEDDVKTIECECKAKALRLLSAPKYFSNTVGRSPSC